ncbi:MAG: translation elongation factor Ts [Micrococcaceae bacterium]
MAAYTTADIKDLRERTGAGMMDVKKALDEANGDINKAVEIIRIKGLKGATKREGRATSEGLVAAKVVDDGKTGVMVELLTETDFVAKNERFGTLGDKVLKAAIESKATTVDELNDAEVDGEKVSDLVTNEGAVIGEKIEVRRVARVEGKHVYEYLHRTSKDLPPQVGVLLAVDGEADEAGHDVAVHMAAYAPQYMTRDDVPSDIVEKERSIAEETAKNEGKPEKALPMIVEGRLNGFFKEGVLVDQPFAKDPKQNVGKVLDAAGVKPVAFARFRVGEEIAKDSK